MKKTVLLFILSNISIIQLGYSQVGIGTNTPSAKSILDLTATDKGFLLPRMDSAQRVAITPTITDIGMQVFDTTTNSIWYWDGTIWVETKVVASNGVTKTTNTVELGGALTKPTTVSALTDTNKMSFTGTGVDAFNVDGITFSVDATNNRVGIGTTTPSANLEVSGSVELPGVAATVVPGPYQAVGINTTTGQLGTFTPGSTPLFVLQTKVGRETLNTGTAGASIAAPINTTVGPNSPDIVYNTIGATLGTEAGAAGVANEYIQIPTEGTYRVDFASSCKCSNSVSGFFLHINILKAPNGSTTYTSADNVRLFRQDILAGLGYPGNTTTVLNFSANDKVAFRFTSPGAQAGTGCGNLLGTGASFSIQIIITKL